MAFAGLTEAWTRARANKRGGDILKKSDDAPLVEVETSRLVELAEQALWAALQQVGPQAQAALAAGDLTASLQALAVLKEPVDAFFDAVMVNAEDPELRANRLALLRALHGAMNQVADLSRLAT